MDEDASNQWLGFGSPSRAGVSPFGPRDLVALGVSFHHSRGEEAKRSAAKRRRRKDAVWPCNTVPIGVTDSLHCEKKGVSTFQRLRRRYVCDAEAKNAGSGSAGIVKIAGKFPRGVFEGNDGHLLLPTGKEEVADQSVGSERKN